MEQKTVKGINCLHFIAGKFVPSRNGRTFENVNPATEEILGTVADGGSAEVDMAVEAAQKAFQAAGKARSRASAPRCCERSAT